MVLAPLVVGDPVHGDREFLPNPYDRKALVQNNFAKMRMFCIMSLWQIPQ
jgi:hypothetical protein